MDALLTAALGAAPQLGGAGLLVMVVVLLIRREQQTSERFAAELDRLGSAHAAELDRVNAAHDAELIEKNAELIAVRLRNIGLNEELDNERARRRAVEDTGRHRAPEQGGPSAWEG